MWCGCGAGPVLPLRGAWPHTAGLGLSQTPFRHDDSPLGVWTQPKALETLILPPYRLELSLNFCHSVKSCFLHTHTPMSVHVISDTPLFLFIEAS